MTTTYTATMPWGETLRISADLTQASAAISYEGAEEGEYEPTPFQTADARHNETEAMMLVIEWLGANWYRGPRDDRPKDEVLAEIRENLEVEIKQ